MVRRTIGLAVCVAVMAVAGPIASGQTTDLTPLMQQTSFGPAEEGQIAAAIAKDITDLVGGGQDEVNGARTRLIALAKTAGATEEFRAVVGKVIVTQLGQRMKAALVHKNRLALTIVVARMENAESLPVLLKLLGEGDQGEIYPSVRYWAAKALATKRMTAIVRGGAAIPTRVVLEWVGKALARERDPICAKALFAALGTIQTEAATDLLISAVAKKARDLDLGKHDAVDAMKGAVDALKEAYAREIRPPAAGKQPIIASLVQVLVQTPPHGESLELVSLLDTTLAGLTKESTGLADAVKDLGGTARLTKPQLVDVVWLEQLNWMEVLLKTANKDVRLLSRPEPLSWSPARSVEVVRKAAEKT